MKLSKTKGGIAVAAAVLALGACDELLTVQDPGRYTASDSTRRFRRCERRGRGSP